MPQWLPPFGPRGIRLGELLAIQWAQEGLLCHLGESLRHRWGAGSEVSRPSQNAVRNMRRARVPQVVRMKIIGHKTDSMERRYNIVDGDDISIAKGLMQARVKESKH
jgi:hypothetical protein